MLRPSRIVVSRSVLVDQPYVAEIRCSIWSGRQYDKVSGRVSLWFDKQVLRAFFGVLLCGLLRFRLDNDGRFRYGVPRQLAVKNDRRESSVNPCKGCLIASSVCRFFIVGNLLLLFVGLSEPRKVRRLILAPDKATRAYQVCRVPLVCLLPASRQYKLQLCP